MVINSYIIIRWYIVTKIKKKEFQIEDDKKKTMIFRLTIKFLIIFVINIINI
jgi:hypothetical protein